MNRELLQQALDALKEWDALIKYQYLGTSEAMTDMQYAAWHTEDAIKTLEAELAKPEQELVEHAVIAGVLFDFMGWLTSRQERLVLSASDEASPAVKVIQEFANMRELSLDDAKVKNWQNILASPRKEYEIEQAIRKERGLCHQIVWDYGFSRVDNEDVQEACLILAKRILARSK